MYRWVGPYFVSFLVVLVGHCHDTRYCGEEYPEHRKSTGHVEGPGYTFKCKQAKAPSKPRDYNISHSGLSPTQNAEHTGRQQPTKLRYTHTYPARISGTYPKTQGNRAPEELPLPPSAGPNPVDGFHHLATIRGCRAGAALRLGLADERVDSGDFAVGFRHSWRVVVV